MHADALGIPIAVPHEHNACSSARRCWVPPQPAFTPRSTSRTQAMTRLGSIVQPDPAAADFHDRKYRVYPRMIDDQRAYQGLMQNASR